jgi:hypothetical protein
MGNVPDTIKSLAGIITLSSVIVTIDVGSMTLLQLTTD